MANRTRVAVGFLFAAVFAALVHATRATLAGIAPPAVLGVFLLGIAATTYFFSWIPALVLFLASLLLTHLSQPTQDRNALDLVQLGVYSCAALGAIAASNRLRSAVACWRRTEEAHRAVVEDASDAVAIADSGGRLLEVNRAFCELCGCPREELLGRNLDELLATGAGARPEDGSTKTQESGIRTGSGDLVPAETSLRTLRDGRVMLIARDLRERKRAEEALRDSEALTRSVVHGAVDSIITIDERGLIRSFNPAAEAMFGYAAAEVLGRNVSVLMPAPHREQHDHYIQSYLRTGKRKVIGMGREAAGLRKDGSIFPIELSISEVELPGRRIFTGIIRDASERKRAEQALREANETLQAVIDASPLAIAVLDRGGRVKSWNEGARRIFGWTEPEALGRRLPVVTEEDWPEFERLMEDMRKGEAAPGAQHRRRTRNGALVDVAHWNALLHNHSGEATGVVCVMADVTERQQLEEQFRQAQKMEAVGRLAGGVAHDFNNILTIITGYAQMLAERSDLGEGVREDIQEILRASDHASALTNQLLVFTRRRVAHAESVQLDQVVERLSRMLRRVIGEDIELMTYAAPGLGQVRVDPSQIEQILMNLAVNARDAMPTGGRLIIETSNVELDPAYARKHIGVKPGPYVLLAVSDTGVGMDAAVRARIFEPFFTTKEKGKGTGLGLSTVYGIVKQCGGEIWVYSEPGHGSTLKIYFPQAVQAAGAAPAEPATPARGGAETVLLVEDELAVRKLVGSILSEHGYSLIVCDDPREALRICEDPAQHIDLLLTDVVMPHMSGRELADRVATVRPRLRVLFMSGYTDHAVLYHGVSAGITPFLQKPFTPDALARKVRQVLDIAATA